MSLHEKKYCPRCNVLFECKAGSIILCQCRKINLNEREQNYLQKNYNDCLCAFCMTEIQSILKNTYTSEDLL